MKLRTDPRHLKRIAHMQDLFSWSFRSQKKPVKTIQPIISKIEEIDKLISKSAPDRPIREINKIDLSILRLSIFELIISKVPPKVVIDEAVELGKEFGGESSPGFINGVLGKVVLLKKINTNNSKG